MMDGVYSRNFLIMIATDSLVFPNHIIMALVIILEFSNDILSTTIECQVLILDINYFYVIFLCKFLKFYYGAFHLVQKKRENDRDFKHYFYILALIVILWTILIKTQWALKIFQVHHYGVKRKNPDSKECFVREW